MNEPVLRARIVLAHLPPLLEDIIHGAANRESDMEVVATIGLNEPCLSSLEAVQADVLICGDGPAGSLALAHDVWGRYPRTRVVTIEERGHTAVLHMLQPHRVTVRDVSVQHLWAAIRRGPAW